MRFSLLFCVTTLALTGAGCTALVDGTLSGRPGPGVDGGTEEDAAMTDAGPPVGACTGMPDGLRCAPMGIVDPFVCIDEICVLSTCGDGVSDDREGSMHDAEQCDDGNDVAGDGCEEDCTFSCDDATDCDDLELCSGVETCDEGSHACVAGTPADGMVCVIDGVTDDAMCSGGVCRAGACPDGTVNAGEECDPGTPVDGDGCENDCTFTCESDAECQDADVCNGTETCDTEAHLCMPATMGLMCDDGDACTTDACDAAAGCVSTSVLVDGDGDGHPATTPSCGGDDCDDANALAHPGATEPCGATVDLNCDGSMGTTPMYYLDCDGDGFAASTTGAVSSCTPPLPMAGCMAWVTLRPTSRTNTDCLDTDSLVQPRQTGYRTTSPTGLSPRFDYNCDGTAEPDLATTDDVDTAPERLCGVRQLVSRRVLVRVDVSSATVRNHGIRQQVQESAVRATELSRLGRCHADDLEYSYAFVLPFLLLAQVTTAGCTALVDGTLSGRPGPDAGGPDIDAAMEDGGPPPGACTGMPDGLRCAPEGIVDPFVCIDEICVLSRCGDGEIDDRDGSMHDPEICDDGNTTTGDGCENDCTYSCADDDACDDEELCTGNETCEATTHTCVSGALADGIDCEIEGTGQEATCSGGVCRAGACPDGVLNSGEECDPAVPATNDGCDDDCTFTCETNDECADGDLCNGDEICDTTTHLCSPAAGVRDCDDEDPCTTDSCDATTGCANVSVLVDADGDGRSAVTASCGGDDCDDTNDDAYPGAAEPCGSSTDLNCDGAMGTTPTYYRDCDGDGYAASTSGSVTSCTRPGAVSGCAAWVTLAPASVSTTDCLDTSLGADARPRQTDYFRTSPTGLAPAYDYDCDDDVERELLTSTSATTAPGRLSTRCSGLGRLCTGDTWWVGTREPACGGTATQSYCSGTVTCARTTRTTQYVYCR